MYSVWNKNLLFLLIVLLPQLSNCEENDEKTYEGIFTSNTDLKSLLWTDAELLRGLKSYLLAEENKLEHLKK